MNDTHRHHTKVHDFLRRHPMGVLSTVSLTGEPWGSAIYFVTDEDFNFYFVTRAGTYKYKNLERKGVASLTIADPATQTTVQVFGKVTPLPVQEYMDVFFEKFAALRPKNDYAWQPPVDKVHAGSFMPLKLTPTRLQYADYGHTKTDFHNEYIEKIIG
jgi:uncharacterized pyridoxamine 5'-phosphate oxidase family protein